MRVSQWHEAEDSKRSGYRLHVMTHQQPWSYPEHRHEGACELVVLLYGELIQQLPGRTVEQEPGQVMLLRDGDIHSLSGRDFSYVNVMFSPSWLTRLEAYTQIHGLVAQLGSEQSSPVATVPDAERHSYYELVDELRRYHDHENGRQVFATFLAQTVTRYLAPVVRSDVPQGAPDWLSDAVVWLNQHHDALPSLDELIARTCRCSEHVTRQFTQWLGLSPARYIARLRVDRAAELLSTTNYPVQEICDTVGFNNESYFYRLFASHKGMTPLEWRRKHGSRSIQTR